MKYTTGELIIGDPTYLGEEYGWNVEVTHKDHRGWLAQLSGNTEEEALGNAKMFVKSHEMYEALNWCEQFIPEQYSVKLNKILSLLRYIES